MFIPPGFARVSPYVIIENADNLIVFMQRAFDAKPLHISHRTDGKVANAQMQIGDCQFMLSEASEACPPMPASYYLYVEDADKAVAQALKASGELILEVSDRPYGDRQGGVRDPSGNLWWISQRLASGPYQD
ncbi:MAG: VOC family protein [Gammaproteobacteria bacterium]|nr:VOC family protein [Gammaproteobacteria bacterium]MBU1475755.1 VOC family protein [Gammaproteobacteria bacterium]MBU2003655.1 VOC family protein [Gammaproteobacteria bacterium]MBU2131242.1 VOC family protein [Gammaproteobacteria bacterium]MBU2188137.1 VOC family protein [Gammaproteobacteria bacterium]